MSQQKNKFCREHGEAHQPLTAMHAHAASLRGGCEQGQVRTDTWAKTPAGKTIVAVHHSAAREVQIRRSVIHSLDMHKRDAVDFSASL